MSEKIKLEARSENIVVVGHSASAVVGAEIAQCVGASGFVQWCGTFNSNGDFPWDCVDPGKYNTTTMTILSEQDALLSFPVAIRDLVRNGNASGNIIPTSIENAGHFSGIYDDEHVYSVSEKVSDFIGYIRGSTSSTEKILDMRDKFVSKFGILGNALYRDDVKTLLYGPNSPNSPNSVNPSVGHVHTVSPPSILYALLYSAFPELRSAITLFTVVLPFVFSYPVETRSISISPNMNPFPGSTLSNPGIWAKIPYDGPRDICRDLNTKTFEMALSEVSQSDRDAYFSKGKPMVFSRDREISLVPGCGLVWILTPLVLDIQDAYCSVSSPVVRTGSTLNTKLISRNQCLEWILVRCFG